MLDEVGFSFQDDSGKGTLFGWLRKDLGYSSNWYRSKVGQLIQDGRGEEGSEGETVLLVKDSIKHPIRDMVIEAQIRQLGDAQDSSAGLVFGYRDEQNYFRYEERKDYQSPENRFRRLVMVEDGLEQVLCRDAYESDYIPTHIYHRITEDIRVELVRGRIRLWHDNILLWDLTLKRMCRGAVGLYCKGRGVFACQSFSARSLAKLSEKFFVKKPYLQNPTPDSMTVSWETSGVTDSGVEYGTERQGMCTCTAWGERGAIHSVILRGLEADTSYFYRVRSSDVSSEIRSFRTSPVTHRPFRFCVLGDTHSEPVTSGIAENILRDKPDFVVNVGDAVGNGKHYSQWTEYFDSMAPLFEKVPSFHVVGNHEGTAGDDGFADWFFRYFSHPGFTDHYAFTYSNCRFIVLNNYELFCQGSQQYDWLNKEFRGVQYRAADFRVAFFHEPAYCAGWPVQSCDGNPEARTVLIPLFQKHGLDLVFNGHCHDYERGKLGDLHFVITGGGGAAVGMKSYDVDLFSSYASVHHHVKVDVDSRVMWIEAFTLGGVSIDSFKIPKKKRGRRKP